jgi:ADP-ribose pyrophosphatase YjhB (NUDIX family)
VRAPDRAPAPRQVAPVTRRDRTHAVLEWARKIQAIAQNGLAFSRDPYDRERYAQLQELVASLLSQELDTPLETARAFWEAERGYATPKLDVRGGVFRGAEVLLVRERSDGCWTLPGGWVDVNEAPSEAVAREILEESGYRARAVKLAMLVDKSRHPHPPGVHHIYKLFFLCELTGGAPATSLETDAVGFFPVGALPQLSTGRVLAAQIERLYRHRLEPALPTDFD